MKPRNDIVMKKTVELLHYSIPREISIPVVQRKEPFYVTNSRRKKDKFSKHR